MRVIVQEPGGPRNAVTPSEGYRSAASLMRSLALTLAAESEFGVREVTLRVNLSGVMPEVLHEIARALAELDGEEAESTAPH
ncbi:MAG: hypothetical protein FIB06_14220 [Betaproteobacteria bacterium]|nr:hypothetical protein [Betaproteobacteria bacterium]